MKKGKHEYRFKLEPFSLVATHFIDAKYIIHIYALAFQ